MIWFNLLIARGTFYNYFDDVNNVFEALIHSINSRIQEDVKRNEKRRTPLMITYGTFESYLDFVSTPREEISHQKPSCDSTKYISKIPYDR